MLQLDRASLTKIIVHRIGNKTADEGYKFSEHTIDLAQNADMAPVLLSYFLKPFVNVPLYNFTHVNRLNQNEVYNIAADVFGNPRGFVKSSKELGRLLYECSVHPKVKDGELYVAYFKGCHYENKEVDAIGIFKSENKDTFLKPDFDGSDYRISSEEGTNINKLDKGCIIVNTQHDKGYVVAVIDNISRGNEAQYWKDEFLNLRPANDNYHFTHNYLDTCKNFVTTQLEQEYEVTKTDKIDYLNRTVDYFKGNETFEEDGFLESVFGDKEVIKSFKKFKDVYASEAGLELDTEFDISSQAVKKQNRVFKSVLKLDKNFHVYIHGDKSLIEKGYDAKLGKSYYKIYFDEET
ncbi:MAG: hypothetical protein K0Q79_2645 [Flavipsychrobacter sp.]|jgi:hypothetical protein|nr:hypothetical protein [Flavipsychrobacter sp.]